MESRVVCRVPVAKDEKIPVVARAPDLSWRVVRARDGAGSKCNGVVRVFCPVDEERIRGVGCAHDGHAHSHGPQQALLGLFSLLAFADRCYTEH